MTRKITASRNVTAEMTLNTSAWRMKGMSRSMRKNSILASGYLPSCPRRPGPGVCGTFCLMKSPGRCRPLRCGRRLPYLADGYLVELLASAVQDRYQAPGDEHRREHRRENAQAVHDREAPHRPRAEDEQRDPGDERGHVGVENRVPGALVAS